MTAHRDGRDAVSDSSPIRLGSPIDVVASAPYLLGFAPANSVVLVFFQQHSNLLVVTGRVDFPAVPADEGAVFAQCRQVFASAQGAGATAVHTIVYPPPGAGQDRARTLGRRLCAMADAADIAVFSSGVVMGNRWYDASEPDCPGVQFDPTTTTVAAGFVSRGVSYLPDREALRDLVVGPQTELAGEARAALMGREPLPGLPNATRSADRRAIEDAIISHLLAPNAADGKSCAEPMDPRTLACWAIALADRRIREPVLRRMASCIEQNSAERLDEHWQQRALDRLCWLVRNTPDEVAAPISATLAAVSWQAGNGALALIAADHALMCDSTNNLADLVETAVGRGVPPSVWISLLTSMTLAELRSGRSPRRSTTAARSSQHGSVGNRTAGKWSA
ncbi:MAG: DUF4192 domain-containing protein [Actinomycetes bacterium]